MKIFLIAGEASGDRLGAGLITALRARNPDIEFMGIGGAMMKDAGMDILLPMDQLSVMGIWEILPKIPQLLKIYKATLQEIEKKNPDAVITIDAPDFNFRISKALRRKNISTKLIHYVAPTVWAWRPGRAKKIAKFLDGLLCLFPFEPRYFKEHGLVTEYVGHPMIEEGANQADGKIFREKNEIPEDVLLLGLLFGSRKAEIALHAETIKNAAKIIQELTGKEVRFVVPSTKAREYEVSSIMNDFTGQSYVVVGNALKWNAMAACDCAIAVSGTVGLELAYAGVPHVICYKMNPVTYYIAKALIQVEHVHLANIILKRGVVPEFLQKECNAKTVANSVLELINQPEKVDFQRKGFAKIKDVLQMRDKKLPSERAADFVLNMLK